MLEGDVPLAAKSEGSGEERRELKGGRHKKGNGRRLEINSGGKRVNGEKRGKVTKSEAVRV